MVKVIKVVTNNLYELTLSLFAKNLSF